MEKTQERSATGFDMIYLVCYLAAINLAAFLACGLDKHRAKKGKWRIPERTLFLLACAGGSVGLWAGMQAFRHKTRHNSFRIGVPVIFVLQCVLVGLVWYYLKT